MTELRPEEKKMLIFIPTYNESENVGKIYEQIKKLNLSADILFLDDNSPDGTGKIMDEIARNDSSVSVIHRAGKLGIGSAHQDGIAWAYDRKYPLLVTMDCDFTHQPEDIRRFVQYAESYDVVIGSRYMDSKSLADWNLFRKFLTHLGHFLTRHLLHMPYDASGAFRLYRLDRIPKNIFKIVRSKSYSFFFESLHVLLLNGYQAKELSILLPKRTYGHSKMRLPDAWASFKLLWSTWFHTTFRREDYLFWEPVKSSAPDKAEGEAEWDRYWAKKERASFALYDWIAAFYRVFIIKPALNHFIFKTFDRGARLLHAGCGGGQVDTDVVKRQKVTALDISINALNLYKKVNLNRCDVLHGSIFEIPNKGKKFDGIYNLGLMEHFTEEEIRKILKEFSRVLNPEGLVVLFWPPVYGLSVFFLKIAHFILNNVLKKNVRLHPDEITHLKSKDHAKNILESTGFDLQSYSFGAYDLFTYAVVIGRKKPEMATAV